MAEAGGFADTVSALREEGLEVDAWLAGWDYKEVSQDTVVDLADWATDAEDPDRHFVVVGTDEQTLGELFGWKVTDGYPLRCVIAPDRTISWCEGGHGLAGEQAERARELAR